MHSHPWCSSGMRWNNTMVYLLLLELPSVYYNALSRIYLYTYSSISRYVVDVGY